MPGEFSDLVGAIPKGRFLRVADCTVKSECNGHFRDAQQNIWIPEMQHSRGMLGGFFNSGTKNESCRFLVTTLWDNRENHNR